MIRLENLTKAFGGRTALEPLTLEVPAGQVFGLLGHNGAGKSTTFGLILGQLHPTGGEAFVRGVSVQRERGRALQRVGAIFETPAFYDYLSGWRNLCMLTALSGHVSKAEIEETVRYVGLEERIHALVRVYSHGMRQRLALAQALLPHPDLVLLDEPAEGLDPEGIKEMRELILRLNRERGMTVVLSSHLLSEVEQTCDRIAILNRGRLVFQGHWRELSDDRPRYRLEVDDRGRTAEIVGRAGGQVGTDQVATLPAGADVADLVARIGRRRGARAGGGARPAKSGGNLPAHHRRQPTDERLSRWHNGSLLPGQLLLMNSLWLLQFRHELTKLFARRRTYIGFGAFLAVEFAVLLLLRVRKVEAFYRQQIEQNGYVFKDYYSGPTLAVSMVMGTVLLLGGLYLALVSGDVVSKDVEEGTMRMMLCRPISRTRIILIKYFACAFYTFALTFYIGLTALLAGVSYRGFGGLFVFDMFTHIFALHAPGPGLVRYFAAFPLMGFGLLTITSLGFMLSCLNMKPAAATIVALSVIFLDFILHNFPYFESIKPFFYHDTHRGAGAKFSSTISPGGTSGWTWPISERWT